MPRQPQKVLDKIDTSNEVGLRDRALLGTLAYTFARIGAVVNLKVEDYFQTGKRSMIRFSEKGGKETEIPVHHKLEELLDQYLETSGLALKAGTYRFKDLRRLLGQQSEQKVFAFADNHPLIRDLTVYSNFINQFHSHEQRP